MDISRLRSEQKSGNTELGAAIKICAPGTALRHALDMIIAAHLGALICIGDAENVLAAGSDGFKIDVSFTANRLFELAKMDGAIVIDRDLTKILRANYHLNPDPSLPTAETGMRHRTAARMSLLTRATVISVSQRRQITSVYVGGKGYQLRTVADLMGPVNQLIISLQNTRTRLDRSLLHLTALELDGGVTMHDVTESFYLFELLITEIEELDALIDQLGSEATTIEMQREEFIGDMDEEYTLTIRDYARDSSLENALAIRKDFKALANRDMHSPKKIAEILGFDDKREDSIMTPLGFRTLNNVSVVREGMVDKIVDEYGSLQELLEDVEAHPERLDNLGVNNPDILTDSLHRMGSVH